MPEVKTLAYPAEAQQYLNQHYSDESVGDTIAERLSYWRNKHGEISVHKSDEENLVESEIAYLLGKQFPKIFPKGG